jgi:hypothetical protein
MNLISKLIAFGGGVVQVPPVRRFDYGHEGTDLMGHTLDLLERCASFVKPKLQADKRKHLVVFVRGFTRDQAERRAAKVAVFLKMAGVLQDRITALAGVVGYEGVLDAGDEISFELIDQGRA